jgi:hypothetical protein
LRRSPSKGTRGVSAQKPKTQENVQMVDEGEEEVGITRKRKQRTVLAEDDEPVAEKLQASQRSKASSVAGKKRTFN